MGKLRLELRGRFGDHFGRCACARGAGIAERTWASYERGENMPPVDAALAIAQVLGVTVEQLGFERRAANAVGSRTTYLALDESRG